MLQWNETKIGRRLRCSGKPWRIANSACMYQPKQRTHVPGGMAWYIDASRWTVITSRSASRSSRPTPARPVAEGREEVDELLRAVQAHAGVPHDVDEAGDALDVVADVRGGPGAPGWP